MKLMRGCLHRYFLFFALSCSFPFAHRIHLPAHPDTRTCAFPKYMCRYLPGGAVDPRQDPMVAVPVTYRLTSLTIGT